jgi:glycosyltransferase involved in cell wall biosynthesis
MSTAAVSSAASYSFYRKALNSCAAIAAFGPQQRRWLVRLANVDEERVHEIPHGVNHIRFCPGHSEWRDGIDESFIVGYVGRFAPEKNLEALCQGFLQAGVKDSRLILVGQGPSRSKLRKRFGNHESISLLDPIADRARVADLMRGLDVFVLPSHIEGLSLSMLEAMASGVVPVATDVGEHHSLVDGCGVLLSPSRTTEGVRRILVELATHPDRRKGLAAAARTRARRRGWDRTTSEILELYRKVM